VIIKLILLVVVGIFVYRLLGGTFPPLKSEKYKEKKVDRGDDFSKNVSPTNSCAVCGTYMTESDAIIYKQKSYCSKGCLERAN
jgi:formylmethanofuran dehydrogenase subunit E